MRFRSRVFFPTLFAAGSLIYAKKKVWAYSTSESYAGGSVIYNILTSLGVFPPNIPVNKTLQVRKKQT